MKVVLKTCKHPHKVFKPKPGVKIIDILPLAKNKEFGGGGGSRKYWSLNKRNTEYTQLYRLKYVLLDIWSPNKYIINEEVYSSSSSSVL